MQILWIYALTYFLNLHKRDIYIHINVRINL